MPYSGPASYPNPGTAPAGAPSGTSYVNYTVGAAPSYAPTPGSTWSSIMSAIASFFGGGGSTNTPSSSPSSSFPGTTSGQPAQPPPSSFAGTMQAIAEDRATRSAEVNKQPTTAPAAPLTVPSIAEDRSTRAAAVDARPDYAAQLAGISAPADVTNLPTTRFDEAAPPITTTPIGEGVEAAHQAISGTPKPTSPAAPAAAPARTMTPIEKTAFAYDRGVNPASEVSPSLQAITTKAQSYLPPNMTLGIVPFGGVRDPALQAELKAGGWSKTMNSYHLKDGQAIDLLPRIDGQVVSGDPAAFKTVHDAMMRAADELGTPVTWGGDWKGFKDEPHYQVSAADAAAFKQPQTYDPTTGKLVDTANLYPVPITTSDWLTRAGFPTNPPIPPANIPNVPPGSNLPAGMRNNNPGNLKYTGSDFQRSHFPGIVGPSKNTDQGDPQIVFDTPASGMAAAAELARVKFDQGMDTVNKIITSKGGWTPGYGPAATNIARTMGIGPNDPIDLHDPAQMQSFLRALTLQEHGPAAMAYTDADIAAGVRGDRAAAAGAGGDPYAAAFRAATPYPGTGLPPAAGPRAAAAPAGPPTLAAAPPAASLRIGASGPGVRDLQTQLLAAGFNPGTIDGVMGPQTRAALVAFQRANPGTGGRRGPDARAGPRTQAALTAANRFAGATPPANLTPFPPSRFPEEETSPGVVAGNLGFSQRDDFAATLDSIAAAAGVPMPRLRPGDEVPLPSPRPMSGSQVSTPAPGPPQPVAPPLAGDAAAVPAVPTPEAVRAAPATMPERFTTVVGRPDAPVPPSLAPTGVFRGAPVPAPPVATPPAEALTNVARGAPRPAPPVPPPVAEAAPLLTPEVRARLTQELEAIRARGAPPPAAAGPPAGPSGANMTPSLETRAYPDPAALHARETELRTERAQREIFKQPPEAIFKSMSSLPPEQRVAARGDFVGSVMEAVKSKGPDVVAQIEASPQASRQLAAALGPQGANKFITMLRAEAAGPDLAQRLVAAAPAARVDRRVAEHVGRMLASNDPDEFARAVNLVAGNPALSGLLRQAA